MHSNLDSHLTDFVDLADADQVRRAVNVLLDVGTCFAVIGNEYRIRTTERGGKALEQAFAPPFGDPPVRSITEIGPGDWVKVSGIWHVVESNDAFGQDPLPRRWMVTTINGTKYDMYEIQRYAKAEDLR